MLQDDVFLIVLILGRNEFFFLNITLYNIMFSI